jgi:hypothetical protein
MFGEITPTRRSSSPRFTDPLPRRSPVFPVVTDIRSGNKQLLEGGKKSYVVPLATSINLLIGSIKATLGQELGRIR